MEQNVPVAWGILATGRIAGSFARDLRHVPGARIAAVGSRREESAQAFAAEHGGRAHASYEALVTDPEVEVVYVASPHAVHLEHARMALEAGKHVLCEKPLALDLTDAEEMVRLARRHDRFLMEAMWMACHPVIRALVDGIAAGRFGTPRQVHADLGFVVPESASRRMTDLSLGAGALLDMGIYPLTFADLMLGPAEEVRAVAGLSPRGYDDDVAVVTRHAGGAVAASTASMTSRSPRFGTIATDRGLLELVGEHHHPLAARWLPLDGEPETITGVELLLGVGYGNEALEVARCLATGRRESTLVPHAQTLRLMRLMDEVRAQLGLEYPGRADTPRA